MRALYVADTATMVKAIGKKASAIPRVWKCPCDAPNCETAIVYAREATGVVWFQNVVSFQAEPPYPLIGIQTSEDFVTVLEDDRINIDDRFMLGMLLRMGLAETLLAA